MFCNVVFLSEMQRQCTINRKTGKNLLLNIDRSRPHKDVAIYSRKGKNQYHAILMENINLCNAGEQTEDNLDIGAVAGGKYPFLLEIKLDKMISLLKT